MRSHREPVRIHQTLQETRTGSPPRITTIWGLWILLPLIGSIIWYVRIQNAIDEFWQARGGITSPGLALPPLGCSPSVIDRRAVVFDRRSQ